MWNKSYKMWHIKTFPSNQNIKSSFSHIHVTQTPPLLSACSDPACSLVCTRRSWARGCDRLAASRTQDQAWPLPNSYPWSLGRPEEKVQNFPLLEWIFLTEIRRKVPISLHQETTFRSLGPGGPSKDCPGCLLFRLVLSPKHLRFFCWSPVLGVLLLLLSLASFLKGPSTLSGAGL